MCIYCGTNKYRKIYEKHFGSIPIDDKGRTYDIHHIDNNHKNNNLYNLKAISLQEHYDIHFSQGDWAACLIMSDRMKITTEEKSRLASLSAKRRVNDGTHHFIGGEISRLQNQKRLNDGTHYLLGDNNPTYKRIENGTHHFLNDGNPVYKMIKEGSHPWLNDGETVSKRLLKCVEDGTHQFLGGSIQRKQLEDCKHPSQIIKICENCRKSVNSPNYNRWHGNNCKKLTGISINQTKLTCSHCGKTGGTTNMKRYHFDNCKKLKKL